MQLIYSAANLVDAQLVVDELKAAGMEARISGSYLSGAVGELPADSLVQVWLVSDHHRQRARTVIDEFESSRRLTGPELPCPQCGELLGPQFGRCWQCAAWVDRP